MSIAWTAHDRTIIARMERYLNESENMKVDIEKVELLRGPKDSEVDLRYTLTNARRKRDACSFKYSDRCVRDKNKKNANSPEKLTNPSVKGKKSFGYDGTKEEFVKRSIGRLSETDFQEVREKDERISEEK